MLGRAISFLFPVAGLAWIYFIWRRHNKKDRNKGKRGSKSKTSSLKRHSRKKDGSSANIPRNKLSRNQRSKKRIQDKQDSQKSSDMPNVKIQTTMPTPSPSEEDTSMHFVHSHLATRPWT